MDSGDMSFALVAKWVYNYANNKDALWQNVVCSCSGGNQNILLPVLGSSGNNSILLRFVNSMVESSGQARDVINQHFKILVADDRDTNLWNDN